MACWGFHKWGKWETVSSGKMIARTDAIGLPVHNPDEGAVIGAYEHQKRVCQECGMSQLREAQT
jgi:hypothetical protein